MELFDFTSLFFSLPGVRGSTPWGDSRPPKPPLPPRRGRAHYTSPFPGYLVFPWFHSLVNPISRISVIAGISGKSREKARVLSTSNRSKPIRLLTQHIEAIFNTNHCSLNPISRISRISSISVISLVSKSHFQDFRDFRNFREIQGKSSRFVNFISL